MRVVRSESRWAVEAAHAAGEELRLYGATARALLRSPRRFGQAWGDGELRALNPLGFAGTTLAVLATLSLVKHALPGGVSQNDDGRVLAALLTAAGPYLHLATLGVLSHFVIKPWRRRRSLLGSVGLALYAGGVASLLTQVIMTLVVCVVPSMRGDVLRLDLASAPRLQVALVMMALLPSFLLFVFLLGRALGGLHRLSSFITVAAVLAAFFATGFIFGHLRPPGSYGVHLVLQIVRTALGEITVRLGAGFN